MKMSLINCSSTAKKSHLLTFMPCSRRPRTLRTISSTAVRRCLINQNVSNRVMKSLFKRPSTASLHLRRLCRWTPDRPSPTASRLNKATWPAQKCSSTIHSSWLLRRAATSISNLLIEMFVIKVVSLSRELNTQAATES